MMFLHATMICCRGSVDSMLSNRYIICLQLKALSIGTNSVTLHPPDSVYATAFGQPYRRELCYRGFASSNCMSRQHQMQVKVR